MSNDMEFLSPLRYPGGKAKVSDFVQCLIKENALLDGIYVEPYVGGGSVALSLLFNEYVKDIYINDKDIAIYAFWHSVLYEPEALCKLIKDTPVTVETWFKLRDYQDKKDNVDLLHLGFSTSGISSVSLKNISSVYLSKSTFPSIPFTLPVEEYWYPTQFSQFPLS